MGMVVQILKIAEIRCNDVLLQLLVAELKTDYLRDMGDGGQTQLKIVPSKIIYRVFFRFH